MLLYFPFLLLLLLLLRPTPSPSPTLSSSLLLSVSLCLSLTTLSTLSLFMGYEPMQRDIRDVGAWVWPPCRFCVCAYLNAVESSHRVFEGSSMNDLWELHRWCPTLSSHLLCAPELSTSCLGGPWTTAKLTTFHLAALKKESRFEELGTIST